jgi:hypothetical protein
MSGRSFEAIFKEAAIMLFNPIGARKRMYEDDKMHPLRKNVSINSSCNPAEREDCTLAQAGRNSSQWCKM